MKVFDLVRRYPVVVATVLVGVSGLGLLVAPIPVASAWLVGGYALGIAAWQAWSMVRDLLNGNFGLDLLAVTAIAATVLVGDHSHCSPHADGSGGAIGLAGVPARA